MSESDTNAATAREQIEYIDLAQLDDDPCNFYELSGLEELAAKAKKAEATTSAQMVIYPR